MKMKKRLTAWLTCVAMVLSLFAAMPMTVLADGPTVLNISEGAINITEPGTYIITGTSTTNTITVAAGVNADITLNNVNIDVSGTSNACAFQIATGSTGDVNITLVGENILKSGGDRAGLQKNGYSEGIGKLTIGGEGSLTATGGGNAAGIGGGFSNGSSHITIEGGTITAMGGGYGAGIGGGRGSSGRGENITIRGGTVTAIGQGGAGIGRGGDGGSAADNSIAPAEGKQITVYVGGTAPENWLGTYTEETSYTSTNSYFHSVELSPDFIVSGGSEDDYTYANGELTFVSGGTYEVSMARPDIPATSIIAVDADIDVNLSLNNLHIDVSGTSDRCAFGIADDSTGDVNITLVGENILKSGSGHAGLQKNGYSEGIGTLTIGGEGSLTSTGGNHAAGIGGGNSGSGSYITIEGGTITATTSYGYGAGIGGGNAGSGRHITIEGGTVTATGGSTGPGLGGAAGIGGGNNANGSHITISGGEVVANGGYRSAGIGGGYYGNGNYITISGGTVTANGGGSSAGIGRSQNGSAENNSIAPAGGMQISVYVGSTEPGTLLGTYTETTPYTSTDRYFHSEEEPVAVTLTDITIKTQPTTTSYDEGDELDLDGLEVTLTYSDDSTEDVAFADFGTKGLTADPANGTALVPAHDKVTITHTESDETAEFVITVTPAAITVTEVAIKTQPTTTSYDEGDELDLDGLVVTLNYSDASAEDVVFGDFGTKGLTADPVNGTALAPANDKVTITHTESGKTAEFDITVTFAAITVTDITVSPSTITVEKGGPETFTATVVYSDDSTDNDVAWSINGNSSTGTAIDASGVLTVASEEEAETLTVTATSNADSGESGNADVTVIDVPVTKYTLTVNSGSGGGEYGAGAETSITAEAPSSDQAFDKWISSNGGAFADETESTTTFTMPAHAVTVTATYKDKVVTPDTYTVTISGGGSGARGSGSYEEGATVTINAGNRSNYSFNGWTSSQAVTFAEASAASTSFTMTAADITVTANWTYTGGGSSGGGGGGSISPTVPAADGAVNVSYSTSQGTADLSLSTSKVNDIIDKSKEDEAVIDLSKVRGITGASLPTSALKAFEEAGLDITVKLPEGTVTLDKEAAASVTEQASSTITIEIEEATPPSLTKEQRETINEDDLVLNINIYSGTRKITNFGGTLTIQVPYTGPEPVAVWYLNDQGELEKLNSTFEDGVVTFTTDHLSLYIIGEDTEEPEKEEPFTNPFTDVQEGAWYYDAVKYVYQNSLMMGTGDTTFGTNGTTTRGMLVTILHRLSGKSEAGMSSFSDVAADKYYAKAVAWAAENRIVSGYGNGIFGPEDSITREQMAAILINYAEFKDYDVTARADLSKYTDADTVSDWARDAMVWANAEGLIQGDGAGLNATGKVTRVQVAAILQRFITEITE